MSNTQLAVIESSSIPTAEESISNIHSLFGSSKICCIYDALDENMKKTLCISAGLKAKHLELKLSEFDCLDRAKLHKGINALEPVIKKLAGHSISQFK